MANRTLRRAYSGTAGSEASSAIGNGDEFNSVAGSNESANGNEPPVIDNGTDDERDADGSSGIGVVEIDPDELAERIAGNGDGNGDGNGTRKRRGRKPGSKNRTGSKKAAQTVEPFLMMAHQWAAVFLKTPELLLTTEEAKQLSDAYSNFCEHHEVPVLSEKRLSEINMIAAMALVYGPRVLAARNRLKDERIKRAKNVTTFGPQVMQ